MTEKQIEEKSYKTVYVACDGTEFDYKDQCLKYDKSCIGVLHGRVKQFAINQGAEDELFNCGSCDNTCIVCIPQSMENLDTIRQLIAAHGGMDYQVQRVQNEHIGSICIITIGYQGDGAWFDTLDSIIKRAVGPDYEATHVTAEKIIKE